jgi:hypothetical protein
MHAGAVNRRTTPAAAAGGTVDSWVLGVSTGHAAFDGGGSSAAFGVDLRCKGNHQNPDRKYNKTFACRSHLFPPDGRLIGAPTVI